jgi:pyruvate/2-oxoglutarate dehydrogenase complex dihydrolipoamide acyltransferase (E2) component
MSDLIYNVLRENPNDEFVIIGSWNFKSGAKVKNGDLICTLEATKNSYDVEATQEGYLFYEANEGDRVEVGEKLFAISSDSQFTFSQETSKGLTSGSVITRKAQKIISDYGLDEKIFLAFGSRVGEKEVRSYIEKNSIQLKGERNQPSVTDVPFIDEDPSGTKSFEIHYLNQSKDVIYSKVTREYSNEIFENIQKKNPGSTLGEIVSFALCLAIKKYPLVNTCFHQNKLRRYQEFNLGLAINIGKGLKVPVIKNISSMTLEDISRSFKELAMNYMRDELKGADLVGGTFTVTDLSSLGVKDFMPVVNKDQGAILGICAPSSFSKSFNLVLGFDHRVMDGMYAAQFLKEIEQVLKKI